MEKGLEITFKVPGRDGALIVEAISNIVGNELMTQFDLKWQIFDVTLDKERFYKVCFISQKLTRLHPSNDDKVRRRFDELAHYRKEELLNKYREDRRGKNFIVQKIQEKKEEYDLWQDNFWKYF